MTVQIGSKFTGQPQSFIDTTSGTYWEVLPKFDRDATRLQTGLQKPRASKPDALPTLAAKMLGITQRK